LDAGVEFRGHTPQEILHPFLTEQADILVHPALLESHPLAITEAMALGVPVLGGRFSGGVPWTLDQGQAGTLTDVGNSNAIAASLEDLASNPRQRVGLARAGWERANSLFREETMVQAYLDAYMRAVHNSEDF
jgi:glycosyltransferase involved in cell wall biosynthesis